MSEGLTDAEQLAAVETYLKALKPIGAALRTRVTEDMGTRRVERVGAYLPDGTKMAAVGYRAGAKTAKVTDPAAALRWCLDRYPDEIVKAINPAFLTALLDVAKVGGAVGEPGVDPRTGEILNFIEVVQGPPGVTVTTTKEGVARMEALARGFARTLEAGPSTPPQPPTEPPPPRRPIADPTLSDNADYAAWARGEIAKHHSADHGVPSGPITPGGWVPGCVSCGQTDKHAPHGTAVSPAPEELPYPTYDPDFIDRLENGAYGR